jgi:hypothetical protein
MLAFFLCLTSATANATQFVLPNGCFVTVTGGRIIPAPLVSEMNKSAEYLSLPLRMFVTQFAFKDFGPGFKDDDYRFMLQCLLVIAEDTKSVKANQRLAEWLQKIHEVLANGMNPQNNDDLAFESLIARILSSSHDSVVRTLAAAILSQRLHLFATDQGILNVVRACASDADLNVASICKIMLARIQPASN